MVNTTVMNLSTDLGIKIFRQIMSTPKIDYEKLQKEARRMEKSVVAARQKEDAQGYAQMNEITVFENERFGPVRTIIRDGEPWFVAIDVCRALGISNPTMALGRLDEDERMTLSSNEGHSGQRGGAQSLNIVNEPGLYTLVLGSRKPEAKAFKRWITHEVIPAIRKHGGYLTPPTIEELLDNPDMIVELALRLKAEREKCAIAERELLLARPKVEYFDELVDRKTLTGIRQTAKELKWREKEFIRFLLENRFIYRDQKSKLQPYAEHVDGGLFELKECKSDTNSWSGTQLMITPKGRETFRLLRGRRNNTFGG